jgi:L-2-hydroxyglutarate oxidase LhgO
MKPVAQHERRHRSGRPRKLTEAEDLDILDRAKARRAEPGVVDGAWTRATIANVTQGRFSTVSESFISPFWDMAGGSINAEFLPHQRHVTRKVGDHPMSE